MVYGRGYDLDVKLKNGDVLKKTVDFFPGSEQSPITIDRMFEKFRRLAAKRLAPGDVSRLETLVQTMEELPSVKPLCALLRRI